MATEAITTDNDVYTDDEKNIPLATKAFVKQKVDACSNRLQTLKDEMSEELTKIIEDGIAVFEQGVNDATSNMTDKMKEYTTSVTDAIDQYRNAVEAQFAARDATIADLLLRVQHLEAQMLPAPVPPVLP
jgi:hypothetical protein